MNRSWPRGKVPCNEILLESMKKAYAAGFAAASGASPGDLTFKDADDYWVFDHRDELDSEKKKSGGRGEKKVTPKKPEETPELSSAAFNPECCKARRWNKSDPGTLSPDEPGHGMQCWCPPEDDGFCKKCSVRLGEDGKENWGIFTEPLKDSSGQKSNGKPHPWPALKKMKSEEEEAKKSAKKEALAKKMKEKAAKKAAEKAEREEKKAAEKAAREEAKAKKKKEAEEKKKKEAEEKKKKEAEEKKKKEAEEKKEADENDEVGEAEGNDGDISDAETDEIFPKGDDDELGEDVSEIEEYMVDGFTMKWDRKTNELKDPDDDEVLGKMVKNEEGEWEPVLADTDSDEEEE